MALTCRGDPNHIASRSLGIAEAAAYHLGRGSPCGSRVEFLADTCQAWRIVVGNWGEPPGQGFTLGGENHAFDSAGPEVDCQHMRPGHNYHLLGTFEDLRIDHVLDRLAREELLDAGGENQRLTVHYVTGVTTDVGRDCHIVEFEESVVGANRFA